MPDSSLLVGRDPCSAHDVSRSVACSIFVTTRLLCIYDRGVNRKVQLHDYFLQLKQAYPTSVILVQ
eukprot:scaffold141031_cov18-Tisochrysis_lutea.AAC.1